MKKEIIVVIFIIFLIIIGHICTQNYTKKFFTDVSMELNEIKYNIQSGNMEQLDTKIEEIHEKWGKKFNTLAIFIEHDELEKVETQLITIKADISVNDYDKCIEELEKCQFILEHIEDKDSLKIVNIF